MSSRDIIVKVYRAGSKGVEVALNGDRTIDAALKAAELQMKSTEIVSVNGEELDSDEFDSYTLDDGDRIVLVKNIEGGR